MASGTNEDILKHATVMNASIQASEQGDAVSLTKDGPPVTVQAYNDINQYLADNSLTSLDSLVKEGASLQVGDVEYSPEVLASFAEFNGGPTADTTTPTKVDNSISGSTIAQNYSVVNITNSNVFKILDTGQFGEVEIRPNLKRNPNEIPFLLRLVDSDLKPAAIYMSPGVLVTAIKLAPNPDNFSISSTKMINRYHSMTRWIEEYWGDEMDAISFSGSTFSFFAYQLVDAPNVGLTSQYRVNTMAYKYLQELVKFMQYNGLIFQDTITYSNSSATNPTNPTYFNNFLSDPDNALFKTNHPLAGTVRERLYINMFYDYVSFLGHFESFDIAETSDTPYKNTYSCVFKSERTKYYRTQY